MKVSKVGQGIFPHPRRQDVLLDMLSQAISQTGFSESEFAVSLARRYHELVPQVHQDLPLNLPEESEDAAGYLRAVDALRKRVQRYISGHIHIPAELEEAWVAALPAPYSERCARALVRRYGFLGVAAPQATASAGDDLACVARVSSQLGGAMQRVSEMLADGKIGPEDAALAPEAIEQLMALQADSAALIERIRRQVQAA